MIGGMVVAALIVWAIMHHRYVKSFEDKGWAYEGSPPISIATIVPAGTGTDPAVLAARLELSAAAIRGALGG